MNSDHNLQQDSPNQNTAATCGSVERLVRHTESESGEGNSFPRTGHLSELAYKDGHLTLSGWLLTVESCPNSLEEALAGKTTETVEWYKELLSQWKVAGYPDLGEWPSPGVRVDLLDFSFGAVRAKLSNDQTEPPNQRIGEPEL